MTNKTNMKYDIVTAGSATVDIFLRSDQFIIDDQKKESLVLSGGKIEINDKFITTGGGGTNTAVGFSRLGLNCACVARFGGDWAGNWLKEDLASEAFDKRYLRQISLEETDFSTILLSPSGERIILTHRGKTRIDRTTFPFGVLAQTRWLYLASLEGNIDLLTEVIDQAHKHKVLTVLNPGNRELAQKEDLRKTFSKIEVLIVNEEEAKFFWGKRYLDKIRTIGVWMVVVTCGKQGVYFAKKGEIFQESAPEGKIIDTTGAGDAFSVGLVAGLMWEYLPPKAVRAGMMESLSVIGKVGSKEGLLTREGLEERLLND